MTKALLGGALAMVAVFASGQVDPNRVIATINGEPIKGSEYYHRMEFLPGVGRFYGDKFATMPPGFMTLDQLISEKLTLQLAKSKGVLPSDPEVDAEIQNRTEGYPRYMQDLLDSGLSKDDIRYLVRVDLAQFKVATYGITITDQEADAYFAKHPLRYTVPKLLKLRVIAVATDEQKAAVDAALKSGKSFVDTAKLYSLDATRNFGGDLQPVPLEIFSDETQKALIATKIGGTTGWIKQGEKAWVRYNYLDAKPEQKILMTPALRRSIRRELMLLQASVNNPKVMLEMKELRRSAKIDISEKDFADAYKKFVDQYLGNPSTPTTPPAGPPKNGG